MLNKFVIGVNNSKISMRVLFTMSLKPRPDFMGYKEIISFYFSSEGIFRNTEESMSRIEIIVIFRVFM
jgi:hypothetical protein